MSMGMVKHFELDEVDLGPAGLTESVQVEERDWTQERRVWEGLRRPFFLVGEWAH